MDMPFDSERTLGSLPPPPGAAAPLPVPRWVTTVGVVTVGLAAVALLCAALLFAQSAPDEIAVPAAVVTACLALVCGIAAIVGRRVRGAARSPADPLDEALAGAAIAHLITGDSGRTVYANPAFARFFPGLVGPALDALQRRLVADAGGTADLAALRRELAQQGHAAGSIAVAHPAGPVAWFSVSAHRLGGDRALSLWSFEDVTAQRAIEQELRDERATLADFLDHAPIGFYSVDRSGRFLFVNAMVAGWLGVPAARLIDGGAALGDFLAAPPPPGATGYAPFAGGGDRGEVMLKGAHGRVIHALITQSTFTSSTGLRTYSMIRDLAPDRDWQQALHQSRERFERFFANAPVGIALLDRKGTFAEANAALGAFLGAEPSALIGKTLISFLPEGERIAVGEKLAASLHGDAPLAPVALRLAGKSAALVMSRDSEGGLILHFIDTTDQMRIEAQFTQSQKMQAVGQLAGGVAHDFNNLLTAMIGFCDLLLQQHGPGDRSFPDLMQIKQNANRAANLVRQLLAFSRQQTLQPRVLDITDALADLSHLLRRLIGERIELKVVHGRDLGLVKVDQGQLDQVIINLAVNARDAMAKSGGTLTISTENVDLAAPIRRGDEVMPAGRYVVIAVADTGTGIPKEILDRIFEPFFSTKEVGAGTGLGLATVYGIVKQTGGFVLVDSEVGQGATFSIYLPRHEGIESVGTTVARGASEEEMPSDLTGAGTVLLVEDEDPVRLFTTRALRNKGYEVMEAENAERALEILRDSACKVDLVITDVVMPKIDGPTLIKEVRELFPDRALKVIFISGYTEDNFRKNLDDDVDIHFLAKPFSLKQLAGKVKEVMAERD